MTDVFPAGASSLQAELQLMHQHGHVELHEWSVWDTNVADPARGG